MKEPSYSYADFVARLKVGWEAECRFAAVLRGWGHDVPDPEWWVRDEEDVAAIERQRDQQDFVVAGTLLEVKSRKLAFGTSARYRYPYDTVFLETVYGYGRKARKPDLYVLISQTSGGILVADVRDASVMQVVQRPDRARNLTEPCYAYPSSKLRSHLWLEGFLAARADLPGTAPAA